MGRDAASTLAAKRPSSVDFTAKPGELPKKGFEMLGVSIPTCTMFPSPVFSTLLTGIDSCQTLEGKHSAVISLGMPLNWKTVDFLNRIHFLIPIDVVLHSTSELSNVKLND